MSERPISLAGLRAFAIAAQHLSLTKAAAQMHLSQSAISRQVQGLEDELGFALFTRNARDIALTAAGRTFLQTAAKSITDLDRAVEQGRRSVAAPRVTLTTFASFASMWLIPRLGSWRAAAPNVELDLGASARVVDLSAEGVDVAVRYLAQEDAPPDAVLLFAEAVFPIASRAYVQSHAPIKSVADLRQHTLIEAAGTGTADERNSWAAFFAAHAVAAANLRAGKAWRWPIPTAQMST
jgi:DNA-binding transcriptional LysR family regulator